MAGRGGAGVGRIVEQIADHRAQCRTVNADIAWNRRHAVNRNATVAHPLTFGQQQRVRRRMVAQSRTPPACRVGEHIRRLFHTCQIMVGQRSPQCRNGGPG